MLTEPDPRSFYSATVSDTKIALDVKTSCWPCVDILYCGFPVAHNTIYLQTIFDPRLRVRMGQNFASTPSFEPCHMSQAGTYGIVQYTSTGMEQ